MWPLWTAWQKWRSVMKSPKRGTTVHYTFGSAILPWIWPTSCCKTLIVVVDCSRWICLQRWEVDVVGRGQGHLVHSRQFYSWPIAAMAFFQLLRVQPGVPGRSCVHPWFHSKVLHSHSFSSKVAGFCERYVARTHRCSRALNPPSEGPETKKHRFMA